MAEWYNVNPFSIVTEFSVREVEVVSLLYGFGFKLFLVYGRAFGEVKCRV